MTTKEPTTPSGNSNEIDLGQLFELIRRGFHKIFKGFLRVFLYLKRNWIMLAALTIVGVGVGLLMNNLVPKKLKTEVIVKPNFESKDYLYTIVDEIASNLTTKDTIFFNGMGMDAAQLGNFNITIEPVEEMEADKETLELNNKYLESLQNYKDNDFILEIIKAEILKKSVPVHRITFTYKNPSLGQELAKKIMDYINANSYFTELQKTFVENAKTRIDRNNSLITQIDGLISTYSEGLSNRESTSSQAQGMVLFESDDNLNIPNLLTLKNKLIKETEEKRIALIDQNQSVRIINFGQTQTVQKSLLGKNLVLFPTLLLGGFFVFSFISYLNRKTKELL